MCNYDCMRQARMNSDITKGDMEWICARRAEKPDICGEKEVNHDWFNRRRMHRREYNNS